MSARAQQSHRRMRHLGGDRIVLEMPGPDGDWEPVASFVGDQDGGYQAFPAPGLVQDTDPESASLIAWQHLQTWEQEKAQWGRDHPGEPLPDHLMSS